MHKHVNYSNFAVGKNESLVCEFTTFTFNLQPSSSYTHPHVNYGLYSSPIVS